MNLLILVSASETFPKFFVPLGSHLEALGHRVSYAYESRFATYAYSEAMPPADATVDFFSEFFAKWDGVAPPGYERRNLPRMLYPDFERYEIFGLHRQKDKTYFRRLTNALVAFFDQIVQRDRIDAVIFENVSNAFGHAAFLATERHGKRYLGIASARLPARFEVQESVLDFSADLKRTFDQLMAENTWDSAPYLKDYVAKFQTVEPDYMKSNPLAPDRSFASQYLKGAKVRYLWRQIRYVLRERRDMAFAHQMGNPLVFSARMVERVVRRKLRLRRLKRFFEPEGPQDRFYLYPIHFHPESSTSVLSPDYIDELTTIRNLAFSIPNGTYLYVKDHKSAAAYPTLEFYRAVRRIPNVKLIHYNADTKALIRRSLGVVTLTSTVGYEALLMGTPVYLLGRVFYEFHPMCTRVGSSHELFNSLVRDLGQTRKWDPKVTKAFLESYYRHTQPGSFVTGDSTTHPQMFESIAGYLARGRA